MIEHCCWQLKSSSNSSVFFHHCPNETSIAINVIGSLRHYKRHIDFAVLLQGFKKLKWTYRLPEYAFPGCALCWQSRLTVIGKPCFKADNEK